MRTLLISLGFVTGMASAYVANAYMDHKYPPPPCRSTTNAGEGPMLYAQNRSYTHVDPYTGRITTINVAPSAGNMGGQYGIIDSDGNTRHGSFSQWPPSSDFIPPMIDMGPSRQPYRVQPLEPGWNNWD